MSEFPIKNISMSITDVNTAPGRTPVSYPNQAFTNSVNPHGQFTIMMKPSQMKPAAIFMCPNLLLNKRVFRKILVQIFEVLLYLNRYGTCTSVALFSIFVGVIEMIKSSMKDQESSI